MTTPLCTITLYKTKGTEDKVYGLAIVPVGDLFDCTYFNGRRGGTMQHGKKTSTPGSLEKASAEFEKTMKAKMKDGYTLAESGEAFTNSENAGRISGYLPMLPADLPKAMPEAQLREMLENDEWAAQEKMDGENRIVIVQDGQVQGTNKNGLFVELPVSWSAFAALGNVVLCGEHIGNDLHVFDIHDTSCTFEERYTKLRQVLERAPGLKGIHLVKAVNSTFEKRNLMTRIDLKKGEGLVFKKMNAGYEEGKNGNSYRHKFWESMTCFVTAVNAQRSVAVGATDPVSGQITPLGNVTIPANQTIPAIGDLQEVRYLYRFEGGSLVQPTSIGPRTDVHRETVTTDQITRIKRRGQVVDVDDETLSEQALDALAKSEFKSSMKALEHFMSPAQRAVIIEAAKGEEGMFFMRKAMVLASTVQKMPQTYDTDGDGSEAIAHLRYFGAGGEWYITERDRGHGADDADNHQQQAFGLADGGELCYISINDILLHGGELDFYFEPKPLEACQPKTFHVDHTTKETA